MRKKCAISESVDIWGAGIVLFTLLIGSMRSHGLNKILDHDERCAAMNNIVKQRTDLDNNTKEFLGKLISADSEKRPTAREALADRWFIK